MRILLVTPLYPPEIGGPATYSKLLESELPKEGIEVDVVKFSDIKHLPKIIRHTALVWKMVKKIKGVDIIYAQDPVSVGVPAIIVSKIFFKPMILKVVGDYAWEQGSQRFNVLDPLDVFTKSKFKYGLLVFTLKMTQTLVAKLSTSIIVPSEYLKKVVISWGVSKDKINVVYNTFEVAKSDSSIDSREKIRQDLNISGTILFSVGRLVPWKGFESMIALVHLMKKNVEDIKLFIAGDGPDRKKLDKLIKINNLENEVKMLGRLDQDVLFSFIKASDVFLLNTHYEGLSHQLLEVMALEVPIVTTDVGGNPEIIKTGDTGILVDPDNTEHFISAILWILKNKNERNRLVANAKKSLVKFKKENMINDLVKIFKHI